NAAGTALIPAGSSTPPFGRFRDFFGTTGSAFQGGTGIVFTGPGGPARRALPGSGDFYNYAPANYLMVPQERWLVGGYGEYEINEHFIPFAEVSFVNNRVANELAPTPVTGFFNINVAQACRFLIPSECARFQQAGAATGDPNVIERAFVQRRVLETGPRNSLNERNAFRALGGLRGEIMENLNYEAYYFFARTRNIETQSGNVSRSRFAAGLDGTGTPINIFGPGTLTPEMIAAFTVPVQNSDTSNLQVASAAINGILGNICMGADDIGFAVGGEWRSVSSQFIPDFSLGSGDVIGFNAAPGLGGGYNVAEAFAELRIPLIADRPFFDVLELWGAGRYSDYSLEAVGGVWTYAAGAEWAPVPDIRFRGQYQRAIRAPNVASLFAGQGPGFPPAVDPCAQPSAATDPTVRSVCIATGVPAGSVGSPGLQINPQIEGLFGGNPNLEEERSDSWTIGAVIRPRFIPRLNMTIDYYDIEIDNAIGTFGGGLNNVLNLCYNVIQDPNSVYCRAINRDPSGRISGDEFVVSVLTANIAQLTAEGVDFQVDYTQPLGFSMMGETESRLNFFFLGTRTIQSDFTPVADLPEEVIECAGRFGNLCGEPTPRWKWSTRLSFIDGPMTLTGRWRRIGAVRDDDDDTDYFVERIGATDYFDLAFAFDVSDGLRLTMGVNNLLDEYPVLLGDNQEQSNTFPNTYQVIGRDFFISANLRF
ncbi:MAG: TonB-dependent receptor, partial [Pseudomonadota bacterium]|nr:TonB-dependent receptor [Pseudomonadota bacterium]